MDYKLAYSFLENHSKNGGLDVLKLFSEYLLLFSEDSNNKTEGVLTTIKQYSGIEIPIQVSGILLKKLKKRGFVEYESYKNFMLTDSGRSFKLSLKEELDVSKKNELISKIESDMKDVGISENLNNIIVLFLSSSCSEIGFNPELSGTNPPSLLSKFFKYLNKVKLESKEKYEFITSLFYISLASKVLIKREIFEQGDSFKGVRFYLDSNIIISLLGFHNEENNITITKLIDSLVSLGAELYVFSITVDQLISSFSGYKPDEYLSEIPVNSMYYYMKIKGNSKDNIDILINDFEIILKEKNINIDCKYNSAWLTKIKSEEIIFEDGMNDLSKYKEDGTYDKVVGSNDMGIIHDIGVLCAVKDCRIKQAGNYATILEKAKTVFLTSDSLLCKWNFSTTKLSFPESILSWNLISYVWLKNPKQYNNDFFENFTLLTSRKNIVSKKVWESFLVVVESNIKKGVITKDDCHILLSLQDTKSKLLSMEHSNLKGGDGLDFSSIFNEEQIALIQKSKSEDKKQMEKFAETNKILGQEKEILHSKISKIKDKSIKNYKYLFIFILICFSLLIGIVLFFLFNFLYTYCSNNPKYISVLSIIGLLFGLTKIKKEIMAKFNSYIIVLEQKFSNYFALKRLKKLGF